MVLLKQAVMLENISNTKVEVQKPAQVSANEEEMESLNRTRSKWQVRR